MATVKVKYTLSEAARRRHLIETGTTISQEQALEIDLTELTPAQRKILIDAGGWDYTGLHMSIPQFRPDESSELYRYRQTETVKFDGEPSLDEILTVARQRISVRTEIEADKAKRWAEKKLLQAEYTELRSRLEADIEAAGARLDALRQAEKRWLGADWFARLIEVETALKFNQEHSFRRQTERAWSAARQAKAEADKQAWVEAHGSRHLQRACAGGYDCQRLYVVERAALEAPGYTVDFNQSAKWKDRACPSVAALDAADAAKQMPAWEQCTGRQQAEIVWLTTPPSADVPDDPYGDYGYEEPWEPWEQREGIVVRDYLGRYELVKVIG